MLSVKAFAKINWTLDILGKRADGYHQMLMLMQTVSLADTLSFEASDHISLNAVVASINNQESNVLSAKTVPLGEENLVWKAAKALKNLTGNPGGVSITLEKRIPFGAGMGGGSSDAAIVLQTLNEMWNCGLSLAELSELALSLGADVPFFLHGGLAEIGGIGEEITLLSPAPSVWLVLCQPCEGVSTGSIFSLFDRQKAPACRPVHSLAKEALLSSRFTELQRSGGNVLLPPLSSVKPEIPRVIEYLYQSGAQYAQMTGSGSVVYGVYSDQASALAAGKKLKESRPAASVLIAKTLSREETLPGSDCNSGFFIL